MIEMTTDLILEQRQEEILSELEKARKTVKTDSYSMSIGELISLYRDKEIKLDPAFQRLFRWNPYQKTRLVESILMGIPIPEIFVAQKADGTWHVVDGVQRLSTIYEVVGELRMGAKKRPQLKLTKCKYIPSLDELIWDQLPLSTQREFKKSKIRVTIILTKNSDEAQYEVFQRLNTGGTALEDQEIRNCLILMIDPNFHKKLDLLKRYKNYRACLKLQYHKYQKEFHMELILRMYMGYQGIIDYSKYEPINKTLLSEFIDKETINLIKNADFDLFSGIFKRTFDKLRDTLGKRSFLKYDSNKGDFVGAFNVSAFEMITAGIATNIDTIEEIRIEDLKDQIKSVYQEEQVQILLQRGVKAIERFKGLTEYSKQYFAST